MDITEVLALLEKNRNPVNAEGMRRFGIRGNIYGISMVELRKFARQIGRNHTLAMELWKQDIHEAKLLATVIADYRQLTNEDIKIMVNDFDSWDLCDQSCINVFRYSPLAIKKIPQFAKSNKEFVRRTAFALMATMTCNKKITDKDFYPYFALIEKYSYIDDRKMVYQAIDWALRNIGKRSIDLQMKALELAHQLYKSDNKTCRYIGWQTIKKFENPKKSS